MELREVQKTYALIYQGMMLALRDVKRTAETVVLIDELSDLQKKSVEILGRQREGGFLSAEDNQVFSRIHKVVSDLIDLTKKDESLIDVKSNGVNYCLEAVRLMGY